MTTGASRGPARTGRRFAYGMVLGKFYPRTPGTST